MTKRDAAQRAFDKASEAEFKALRKLAKCQAEVERIHALCAEATSKLWEVDYA